MTKHKVQGVYRLLFPNGKSYIGISKDIHKRFKQHEKESKRSNSLLYKAVRKYGWNNINKSILKVVSNKLLLPRFEILYIKKFKSYMDDGNGYNQTKGGEFLIGLQCSKYTRLKMSKSAKNKIFTKKHRQNMSKAGKNKIIPKSVRDKISKAQKGELGNMYGKKHSPEAIQKISKLSKGSKNGFYGKKHTNETKKKMSKPKTKGLGIKHPKWNGYIITPDQVFVTYREASKVLNKSVTFIKNRCKNESIDDWYISKILEKDQLTKLYESAA